MIAPEKINESLAKVRKFAESLFGEKLEAVILFGSYVRGDYDEDSDVDIMIVADMDARELPSYRPQFSRFGTELDLMYDVFHSFTLQDKATFERWKDSLPFYKNVLQEGMTVYA
ncbi:MAG: nucleotidyltransferase domain-containing protein [Synergistaceae bacterium]|nr:nucleotidyltransferase domain-containing protein [Synergistaceae bacterium]